MIVYAHWYGEPHSYEGDMHALYASLGSAQSAVRSVNMVDAPNGTFFVISRHGPERSLRVWRFADTMHYVQECEVTS